MTLPNIVQRGQRLAAEHAPLIMTAIGVAGTITTAVLAGKASYEAALVIDDEFTKERQIAGARGELPELLTPREKFELVWKLYIPATGTGLLTIGCIIGANRVGTRRAAAMAAAYSMSERAFETYRDKVVDQIGKPKEQKVRDEIAQDRVNARPVDNQQVIVTGGGEVLCFDIYTGRYFNSSMESLKQAQNNFNHKLLKDDYQSLNDFYNMVGLSTVKQGDNVGWEAGQMLELLFSTTMSDDQRPCIAVDFLPVPDPRYSRTH